jgi:hypothetical protein
MIWKDAKGSGRGLLRDNIPAFTFRKWEYQEKVSVTVAGLRAEI